MSVNWLITGGCGFIGRNLIKNLVEESGNHIIIIDNLVGGTKEDLAFVTEFSEIEPKDIEPHASESKSVQLVVADILNEELAYKLAKGMDVIVHLAANTGVGPSVKFPRQDCLNNVFGTLNYLEAARYNGVKRFVFASSGAPLGECTPPIHEELAPHPVSPYGASKLSGEAYCSAYYRTFGIETVILRFGNVYGPLSGRKDSVVAKFIKRALSGETLLIYGDGHQTRDFIFVDDLIQAIQCSVNAEGIGGEIFQIATNRETTISELVDRLISILSEAGVDDIIVDHAASRLGDVKRNFSDTSKAKQMLSWHAKVDLKEGLKRTTDWFMMNPIGTGK